MKLSTMKLSIGFFFGLVLALPVVGHAFLYTPDDYSDGHDRGTCGLNGPCGYPGDPFVFINLTRTYNPDPIPTYEPPQAPAGTCNGASNGDTAGGRQYMNITGSNLTSVNKDNLNVTCNGVPVPASALMFGTQTNDFVQVSFPQPASSGSCTATPQGQTSCQPVAITGSAPAPAPAPAPATANYTSADVQNGCVGCTSGGTVAPTRPSAIVTTRITPAPTPAPTSGTRGTVIILPPGASYSVTGGIRCANGGNPATGCVLLNSNGTLVASGTNPPGRAPYVSSLHCPNGLMPDGTCYQKPVPDTITVSPVAFGGEYVGLSVLQRMTLFLKGTTRDAVIEKGFDYFKGGNGTGE